MRFPRPALLALMLTMTVAGREARAAWPHDPLHGNVAVCKAIGTQKVPDIVSDGAGGAIITWTDFRDGGANVDIYAQRISANGIALWTTDGIALCTAPGNQYASTIVSDGVGGAIVSWYDLRDGPTADIYAQRINASGVPMWTVNGVALCTATGEQSDQRIAADGAGGALVIWEDARSGVDDLYVQRISAGGVAQWTANGVALCTAVGEQLRPAIVSDGLGGAIAIWQDYRSGVADIYARRVNASGVPQWTANGVALCTAVGQQLLPAILPDDAGGAIVTWQDSRNGTDPDIYAQRISAIGVPQWAANGVALCTTTPNPQARPQIASDGAGGAIVTWDEVAVPNNFDVYAQRISAGGAAQWTANGVPLATTPGDEFEPRIVPDGAGGAVVTWEANRDIIHGDIYAQRISASGGRQWTGHGVAVCTAPGEQGSPLIVTDGAGGAIVTWPDFRGGEAYDIYAQRVERHGLLGPEPAITGVRDVPNDQGGFVKVSWNASYLDADPTFGIYDYRLWRSVPASLMRNGAALLQRGIANDADEAAESGRLLMLPLAGLGYAWELIASQPAGPLSQYSLTVAMTSDSVGGSNPHTAFMVQGREGSDLGARYWFSAPDSGYSVDNLPPAMPAPFTGQYGGGTTALHWNRNTEADLAGYRLYRGSSAAFVPDPANLVATPPDTGYVDAAGGPYVYKLTAVDSHGNESPVATLVPGGVLDAPGGPLATFFLAPVAPNPAKLGAAATLRFGLSRSGAVRLEVIDAAGRRVRVLASGELAAGEHRVRWDGRSEGGQRAAAGLYFVRLEAEGRRAERRLALIE